MPYYDQVRAAVKWFVENKGAKKIGMMYQDDEMGHIMMKGLKDQLAVHGLEVAAAEPTSAAPRISAPRWPS